MSTKDNSNNKQNKGFIAILVEKARKIFDTDESKNEKSKKTNSIKKVTYSPKNTSGKHSATTKRTISKKTTASKASNKTSSKTKATSRKETLKTTNSKPTKTTKAVAKTEVSGKDLISKLVDDEKLFDIFSTLSVEEKDNKENVIEKIEVKEKKNEKSKATLVAKQKEKENENDKNTNRDKENIKEIAKDKEKTDSEKVKILEYYDLPFRYNKTVVKVLAQTPNRLFIYWDVSDEDKQALIDKFGPYFYNNTKPVLIVHNKTMNYSFEVDINDYANSWYLHVNDSKCDYDVELGRRSINKYAQTPNGYLEISHSNSVESPNDHILFDELGNSVVFENVKTAEKFEKDITSSSFLKRLGDLLNIKGLYDHLYEGEVINNNIDLNNPTS